MRNINYYDITPLITTKIAVFPGDQAYQRTISMDFDKKDHLQLSSFVSTFHLGAHADSSSHYHKDGVGVEQRPLAAYYGTCQVVEVLKVRDQKEFRISPADVHEEIKAKRIIFKTNSFPDPNCWNANFFSLSPELINFLHKKEVVLVGIDTPSVDPQISKTLDSHQALYQTGMCVLEGLFLPQVPPGCYCLVALPLPFVGADASPVRAILIDDKKFEDISLRPRYD